MFAPGEEHQSSGAWSARSRARRQISGGLDRGVLVAPGMAQSVETPSARSRGEQIQKDEAEQDCRIATIDGGKEAPRRMNDEVSGGHLTGQQEGDGTGDQPEQEQDAT